LTSLAAAGLAESANAVDRSNAFQEKLWQQATAMAAKDKGLVPPGLFIQALSETIDNQEVRLTHFALDRPSTGFITNKMGLLDESNVSNFSEAGYLIPRLPHPQSCFFLSSRSATTALSSCASRRKSLTSPLVAARVVSPAKRRLPASLS
jgi:hypothetical protein